MKNLTIAIRSLVLLLSFVAVFVACKKDEASSMMTVSATLSAANEVPVNPSRATGTLTGTYDKDTKIMTIRVTWTGIEGGVLTGMHIHGPASTAENAGVLFGFSGYPTTSAGEFSYTSPALTAAQETDALAGKWYINVHSNTYRGGEIRGQLSVK